MPFFFAEREGGRAFVRGADAAHLARSLRARAGEEIEVVDAAAGSLLTVRLDVVTPELVEGAVIAEREHRPEPSRRVTVAISNLPAPALELVLSRCTEVGAAAFHVVQADRSVARGAKPERWSLICREAAMLAGRLRVPKVTGPSKLDEVLARHSNPILLTRDAPISLSGLEARTELTLLIGPEGGWTDRERALVPLRAHLGPRNMRADTAAIVALARVLVDG